MERAGPSTLHVPREPVRLLVACKGAESAHAVASRIAAASVGTVSAAFAPLRSVVREAQLLQPDVVLLEHHEGSEEKLYEVIERIARVSAHTRIVLLCPAYFYRLLVEFVRRGVTGCVLEDATPEHWVAAVMTVYRGEPWFRRTALLRALRMQPGSGPVHPSALADAGEALTAREREILALVRGGLTNKEIGRNLEISDKTVKTHLHNIYRKLKQRGRYPILLGQGAQEAA